MLEPIWVGSDPATESPPEPPTGRGLARNNPLANVPEGSIDNQHRRRKAVGKPPKSVSILSHSVRFKFAAMARSHKLGDLSDKPFGRQKAQLRSVDASQICLLCNYLG